MLSQFAATGTGAALSGLEWAALYGAFGVGVAAMEALVPPTSTSFWDHFSRLRQPCITPQAPWDVRAGLFLFLFLGVLCFVLV